MRQVALMRKTSKAAAAPTVGQPTSRSTRQQTPWLLFGFIGAVGLLVLAFIGLTLMVVVLRVFAAAPVSTLGMDLSGLHDAALLTRLNSWNTVQVVDGDRQWSQRRLSHFPRFPWLHPLPGLLPPG